MLLDGPTPAIEADRNHLRFIEIAQPNAVLISLTEAQRLLNRDDLTLTLPTNTKLVTSSTVADRHAREWHDELDLIETLKPAFHIPTDGPVYRTEESERRTTNTLDCLEGTVWMDDQLAGTTTDILPLLKGTHPRERELCYRVFDRLGYGQCGFYAGQYFSSGTGPVALARDLTRIANETDLSIVALGVLGPECLRRLPDGVVAASGINAWRNAVEPGEATDDEIHDRYERFVTHVEDALQDSSRQPDIEEIPTDPPPEVV